MSDKFERGEFGIVLAPPVHEHAQSNAPGDQQECEIDKRESHYAHTAKILLVGAFNNRKVRGWLSRVIQQQEGEAAH
ncbi:hypothetical protein [Timonella senegalensis]|uniref:hypothetical protein n=1 Tax=Timonella senegalensis TaxID=1465825 RepID=UPI001E59F098|nr:hypothetical protein [Timonella senegalensis]